MTSCMKASDGKVVHVHVYAMYCMLAKGALLGPQNPSEMGLMRGSKSLAFWGRGGPKSLLHLPIEGHYELVLLLKPGIGQQLRHLDEFELENAPD